MIRPNGLVRRRQTLRLETRLRSPNWVYSYLLSFYPDETRPYGVNNKVFKDVAMPHVLADLEPDLKPESSSRRWVIW
jgi:ubiquinol-cytochrome c reductase cytochrome c1 subunit